MSPDEIRTALSQHYPELQAAPRVSPDGWSFYLGAPVRGTKSNRIIRATRSSAKAITRLKLAASSRHSGKEEEIRFGGTPDDLFALVAKEIELFNRLSLKKARA